ncbi:hypothetical protein [Tabrizicola sp.]|uniref:hypothetical protein n=1 Tax=Tabrizicola sp. TaxID=2005166 RepID=UPI0027373DD8|nr:hypothetical protein [Tabrizicola sp.]MDP3196821.1 hypothetical protein [Tabrizicola sp.]MDZ4065793.1 hypothetical protein [Tabrizicola sp.]
MAKDPSRKKPGAGRPEIWASGGQRPPFDLRALGRAGLYLARQGVAPIHAWAARRLRAVAIDVKDGQRRIPAEKLGRASRFVPSHLRVAGWVKTLAATLSHASATADPDVRRGNALVAEIQPHLWDAASPTPPEPSELAPALAPGAVAPVVLPEPKLLPPGDDPLASIRSEIGAGPMRDPVPEPDQPPAPPGPVAEGAIQVSGYAIGWATVLLALPYGLGRGVWLWAAGRDLRQIGADD